MLNSSEKNPSNPFHCTFFCMIATFISALMSFTSRLIIYNVILHVVIRIGNNADYNRESLAVHTSCSSFGQKTFVRIARGENSFHFFKCPAQFHFLRLVKVAFTQIANDFLQLTYFLQKQVRLAFFLQHDTTKKVNKKASICHPFRPHLIKLNLP